MTKHKLEKAIRSVLSQGNKGFVPYVMAGDGGLEKLKEQLLFFQDNGATVVELGVPFSDPVADGPTIQAAGGRALAEGITLRQILHYLTGIKKDIQIPIVLMTYLNPLLQYGLESVIQDAKEAGVSGFIIPDVPSEEEGIITPLLKAADLALIRLVTVTSPIERIEKIAHESDGFLYAVTIAGITGARTSLKDTVGVYLEKVKRVSPVPVFAGFGISTPEQVKSTTEHCDGVIVGSKVIELLQEERMDELEKLLRACKQNTVVG